ncbi:MAG: putative 2-aminoethylphosphonate ABC transporter substrate-binding protein [Spirochaetota bacterium]
MILMTGCGKSGKEITVYTALEDDQIPRYLESFRATHPGIRLNVVRDSTGVITARLLAEKDNPVADVIWGVAVTSLLICEKEGLLTPYAPAGVDRVFPEFKDSHHPPRWVGIDAWMTGIVVNTIETKRMNLPIPRSYADLVKPVYRDSIVMPGPASSGTGFLTVSALIQLMGEKKAWEYMEKLDRNIAEYTHSGSKPAKLAGSGEYPVGISFGYRGIMQKDRGQPVHTVFPSEGSGWDLEANALVNKENIKDDAKVFLDWAISDSAMKEYGKSFAITTVQNNRQVPDGFPEKPLRQLIKNDFRWAAANRDRILDTWNRKFGNRSKPVN